MEDAMITVEMDKQAWWEVAYVLSEISAGMVPVPDDDMKERLGLAGEVIRAAAGYPEPFAK